MAKYRVYCEDCDLEEVYDDEDPPQREIDYHDGDVEKARRAWSAESAAKGKRDNHQMSAFRDYGAGKRHRPHLEEI